MKLWNIAINGYGKDMASYGMRNSKYSRLLDSGEIIDHAPSFNIRLSLFYFPSAFGLCGDVN